jgi:hypothetical protein
MTKPLLTQGFLGADDGIRTRDPHLGKKEAGPVALCPPRVVVLVGKALLVHGVHAVHAFT